MSTKYQRLIGGALCLLTAACGERVEPAGRTVHATSEPHLTAPPVGASSATTIDRTMPSAGHELVSLAVHSWIYMRPNDRSTKLGYLRAGAVVERGAEAVGQDGCEGGWYRVVPRGYICVGKGATLDSEHPIRKLVGKGPRRGEPMPYRYVMSESPPPHLYLKLPSLDEQNKVEGKRRARNIALHRPRLQTLLGDPEPQNPELKEGDSLPIIYGIDKPLAYLSHRGLASEESAFGLLSQFEHTERRMGLTSDLDVIALDRTKVVKLSSVQGVVIEKPGTPAFVKDYGVRTYSRNDSGELKPTGDAAYRSGWALTGESKGAELVETTLGVWLPKRNLRIGRLRKDGSGFARDGRKWIDISIRRQILTAYVGERPVFAALISSGRGEMRDPEKTHATIRGSFMIHAKHIAATMDGDDDAQESFDLRDVPYIQYFYKGYALHGAYWHDDFGKVRSHGCVNLSPRDAAWLFEWTDPQVPKGWHGALNHNAGTLVYIHG